MKSKTAKSVSGESPLLRSEDSNQSSVVSRELLDGLPLSGRRFLDFALLVPNAAPDGQNGLVSFAGEQGGEVTGYANGANSFSGDGATLNQTCYLVPNASFGKLQVINALNGPRVMQFALKWTF
jgi:hypothetical protein